jgi:hypothetical protein
MTKDETYRTIRMQDYQDLGTMTDKMYYLPPSNKKEFIVKDQDNNYYTVDTGMDKDVLLRTIDRLRAKNQMLHDLQQREEETINRMCE